MRIGTPIATRRGTLRRYFAHPHCPRVVAVVVEWQRKIAPLKRSRNRDHDRGLWHCTTSYLEPGVSPKQQVEEIFGRNGPECGKPPRPSGWPCLVINDDDSEPWLVHAFTAVTSRRRLEIDWEHDAYRWTAPTR
jgi:hypothetical protein